MSAGRALAAVAVACACAAAAPMPDASPTGEQILARAKAAFRAHERPPYIVYSVIRRDRHNGAPDFENSYTLKIWCRTSDRDALTRRVWNGKPYGVMEQITVAFDGRVDPGPPSADVFERALYAVPSPAPVPLALPTIGGVVISREYDYRVTRTSREGELWHLRFEPLRDPDRNRIDDLWVDASSYELARMRVRDHLYFTFGGTVDEEFDVRFTARDGLPLITSIHGQNATAEYETDYTYTDVSFPPSLPAWYFEPKRYGQHKGDEPS